MFKKKNKEQVDAPINSTENDVPPLPPHNVVKHAETPKISDINLEALKMLSKEISEKYAYYLTGDEAVGLSEPLRDSLKISLLLAIYDELRQIRALNEE